MSPWLSHMSPRHAVPTNALRVACVVPIIIRLYVYVDAGQLPRVTAFAVLGICIAFQAVVLDALRQWPKGWRPAGNWNLGSAGMLVNVIALAYGIMAIFLLLKRGETGSVLDDRVVAIGLVVVMGGTTHGFLQGQRSRQRPQKHDDVDRAPQDEQGPRPRRRRPGAPSSVSTQSAPEGIRTPNLLIRSQMLYPLSYGRSRCPEDRPAQRWERLPGPRRPAKSALAPPRPDPPAYPDVGRGARWPDGRSSVADAVGAGSGAESL